MQEKAKHVLERGKQWWSNTTKKTKIGLGGGLLAALLAILAVVLRV